MKFSLSNHLHFACIGGIGMSGLARLAKKKGYAVSGCDTFLDTPIIKELSLLQCHIYQGHSPSHTKGVDALIYSSALPKNHPELLEAEKLSIPVIHRSSFLAHLMQEKKSIVVSGTHGKTTTSGLITHLLSTAHFSPSYVIGSRLISTGHQAEFGDGKHMVVEGDESDASFTGLPFSFFLVTNIGHDHIETYSSRTSCIEVFAKHLSKAKENYSLFLCADDAGSLELSKRVSKDKVILYGSSPESNVRFSIKNKTDEGQIIDILLEKAPSFMQSQAPNKILSSVFLPLKGEHMALNAVGAIGMALRLGLDSDAIKVGCVSFKSTERRYQVHRLDRPRIIEDYAHHPRELEALIKVAGDEKKGPILFLFQPHRLSRTAAFEKEFIRVLSSPIIDKLFLLDIYSPDNQDTPPHPISSQLLADQINSLQNNPQFATSISSYSKALSFLSNEVKEEDTIFIVGAGDIHEIVKPLIEVMEKKY